MFSIHSSIDIWLFHTLAIVNNTAMTVGVLIVLQDPDFPGMGLLDHMAVLRILRNLQNVLHSGVAVPIYTATNIIQGPQLLHNLPNSCYVFL
jgi:hypothetical protein